MIGYIDPIELTSIDNMSWKWLERRAYEYVA
jgi:hypothetical protein